MRSCSAATRAAIVMPLGQVRGIATLQRSLAALSACGPSWRERLRRISSGWFGDRMVVRPRGVHKFRQGFGTPTRGVGIRFWRGCADLSRAFVCLCGGDCKAQHLRTSRQLLDRFRAVEAGKISGGIMQTCVRSRRQQNLSFRHCLPLALTVILLQLRSFAVLRSLCRVVLRSLCRCLQFSFLHVTGFLF